MILTLCWESKDMMIDIKVNREQKIADTISILMDGGVLPTDFDVDKNDIFSNRKGEDINLNISYEEAEIYNGDILYIR